MISPHTAPGTKIICVDDALDGYTNWPSCRLTDDLDGLRKDETYTVAEICEDDIARSGFVVIVREIERLLIGDNNRGFDIARFRYASLPSCLTELLNTAPIKSDRETVGV